MQRETSCGPQVNCFFDQRPRWAGASEPRCTSSQAGLLTVGHFSPSRIGNLDPVDDRGSAGEGASSATFVWGWSGGVSGERVWLSSARWLGTAWFKSDKISKKRLFGFAASNRLSLSLPLPFSSSSSFLSFSIQKRFLHYFRSGKWHWLTEKKFIMKKRNWKPRKVIILWSHRKKQTEFVIEVWPC